ncbi:MAG TPA: uroporphyrinogen-III synthase, partial [Longimicrobium sp.]|nr:uroporphyrinogen-III synthase [Longimicrobium sp.]
HEDPTKPDTDVDWAHVARGVGTVVFYMGGGKMAENFRRLVEHGRAPQTPAAAIEWGTYPRQRTVTGTLETLPEVARQAGIGAPSLIVVGEVVSLRDKLSWWERRPLSGRRIVVTRARAQASDFAAALEALGAEVVQFPTIRIVPPADEEPLRRAAAQARSFDWIVFTSVNGVERFWYALAEQGCDARSLCGVKVCAIGPATAGELERRGIRPDAVPGEFVAEAAVETLLRAGVGAGSRVLLPRADIARTVLPERLREQGADVVEVAAYSTEQDGAGAERVRGMLERGEVDLVTFTASSTARNFVELVGTEVGRAAVASIGPITTRTARELGMRVDVEAEEYTIPGLTRAIQDFCARSG